MIILLLLLTLVNGIDGSIVDCCKQGERAGKKPFEGPVCVEKNIVYEAVGRVSRTMCRSVFISCCRNSAEESYCTAGVQAAINNNNCAAGAELGGVMKLTCCDCCKRGLLAGSRGQKCSISQGSGMLCDDSFSACCANVQVKENNTEVQPKSTDAPVTKPDCTMMNCDHNCKLALDGSLVCTCKPGFRLKDDQKSCQDIDECKENTHKCQEGKTCHNKPGSYICFEKPKTEEQLCKSGYVLHNGTCVDEDECRSGSAACGDEFCVNSLGFYSCFEKCPFGYQANGKVCDDEDECKSGGRCGKNYKCVNTIGYYKCELASCDNGYKLQDGKCEDINECEVGNHNCGKNYRCENTNGYYKCVLSSCNKGFHFSNGRCLDVNECNLTPDICGHGRCYNNYGSYVCSCFTGHQFNATTQKCEDIDECKKSPGICESECVNTIGSYTCKCPNGYQTIADNCEDIDECSLATKQCPANHVCFNEYGNYSCIATACPNKFYILRSSYECRLLCPGNHGPCSEMITQSLKWRAAKFKKFVNPRAYKFKYVLRVSSYLRVQLNFNLRSGNENGEFFLQRIDKYTVNLINIKKLIGPKRYVLRMEAEILFRGRVFNRFVYFIYIFVSKYSF